jgi:hypothetical protein
VNSFHENCRFEREFGTNLRLGSIEALAAQGHSLLYNERSLPGPDTEQADKDNQAKYGDFALYGPDGKVVARVEMKVEAATSRNMWFETFSNHTTDPTKVKLGWGYTTMADRLWYGFADTGIVAGLDMADLRRFLDAPAERGMRRLLTFREAAQAKHVQRNLTVGRLVPWEAIPDAVWRKCLFRSADGWKLGGRRRFLDRMFAATDRPRLDLVA